MPHTRRDVLRTTALGSLALAAGVDDVFGQTRTPPPNIVYIMADDLGYADVGCYGRPDLKTPNIDRIAARGVRFLQGYANSAVCSATRTALITGRYQYRLRIGLEEPLGGNADRPAAGTSDAAVAAQGKPATARRSSASGISGSCRTSVRCKSGYDHFYGFRGGGIDYYRHTPGSGPNEDLWDDDVQVHQIGYSTELFGNRAVDVVNGYAKARQPFFLSLHFNAPHWPWEAPGDEAEAERLRIQRPRHCTTTTAARRRPIRR